MACRITLSVTKRFLRIVYASDWMNRAKCLRKLDREDEAEQSEKRALESVVFPSTSAAMSKARFVNATKAVFL